MNLDLFMEIFTVVHRFFNVLVFLTFLYQAWMGFKIRQGRKRASRSSTLSEGTGNSVRS
jgi:threonine/homoserine/homoserine lactone efflux protein